MVLAVRFDSDQLPFGGSELRSHLLSRIGQRIIGTVDIFGSLMLLCMLSSRTRASID